ncbi:amino acid permease-domain-containing protein [Lactifluus volemus]|nr:amino acid permease-domain-containing protein [Lactifluus volemus]
MPDRESGGVADFKDEDDKKLESLGYVPSFKREFSNLATISFAFSIMGLCSSVATTLIPRYSWVTWCWILGSAMCFTLGSSIAEIVSAFPTCGGLYTASAQLVPKDTDPLGNYEVTSGKVNCLATRQLATLTKGFVFVNLGTTAIIIIVLLATTGRHDMHSASYVFGSDGVVNRTNGWDNGIAFLFGLLSVQWTVLIGTGLLGWVLNIVLILCSGPLEDLPGASGSAFLQIMVLRMGKSGSLFLWTFVCLTAFFVSQTALQACSRTVFAFSRDHGFPDKGYFGYVSKWTHTPLRAIWLTTILSIFPGLLQFVSPIAVNAIFSLTAMALDISYIIPIALRRIFRHHPEVQFTPGPFYLGDGLLGWAVNLNCIVWTLFVSVIFSLPTYLPVTKNTMNYASVITGSVVLLAMIWYFVDGHRHYRGPQARA